MTRPLLLVLPCGRSAEIASLLPSRRKKVGERRERKRRKKIVFYFSSQVHYVAQFPSTYAKPQSLCKVGGSAKTSAKMWAQLKRKSSHQDLTEATQAQMSQLVSSHVHGRSVVI
jgi:lipid A disaccharide synthetase